MARLTAADLDRPDAAGGVAKVADEVRVGAGPRSS